MIGHKSSIRARRVGREWLLPLVQCCPAGGRLMVIVQSQALISGLDRGPVSLLSGGAQIVLFCSADSFLFLFFCRFSFRVFCPRGLSAHCAASCVLLWFIRSRPRSVGFVSMVHLVSSIRSELLWHYSQAVHLLWFGRSLHPSHEAGLPPSPRLTGCLLRMRRGHSRLSAVIGLCRSLWRPLAAAAD